MPSSIEGAPIYYIKSQITIQPAGMQHDVV